MDNEPNDLNWLLMETEELWKELSAKVAQIHALSGELPECIQQHNYRSTGVYACLCYLTLQRSSKLNNAQIAQRVWADLYQYMSAGMDIDNYLFAVGYDGTLDDLLFEIDHGGMDVE